MTAAKLNRNPCRSDVLSLRMPYMKNRAHLVWATLGEAVWGSHWLQSVGSRTVECFGGAKRARNGHRLSTNQDRTIRCVSR